MSGRALVLAAHGSQSDPAANALVRRLAQTIRGRRLFDEVAVAFHQGEPGFNTVLDELAADEVTVVPFMTSAGYYSNVVLPEALARNRRYPEVRLRQAPPVGTHPGMASLFARRVSELLRSHELTREATSLVLVGHGTPRHPESRGSTLALVETLQQRRLAAQVIAGFIDDTPSLSLVLDQVTGEAVVIVPFLIGGGTHALSDLPRLSGLPAGELPVAARVGGRFVLLDHAIGSQPGIAELVVDLARRHTPPPPKRGQRGGRPASTKATSAPAPGTVHLVGAGPGDPGLITSRGLQLLRTADVVVHDRLLGHELLHEVKPGAELVDVGKGPGHVPLAQEEIGALLVARAREGRVVVRLKGGDPFVFGRGSEEVAACRAAGVRCLVTPGVSSAIAGPAAAGIPLTARGVARSFAVVTGHQAGPGGAPDDLAPLVAVDTLVVLMGRASLDRLALQLIAAGRDPATPAACIQSATTPEQRVTLATLATIAAAAERDGLQAPVITVIGAVAALAGSELAEWAAEAPRAIGKGA
ncbi:MAG: uroporphyrinogen-III C-methyltransferase [Gemmatimonadota bacterium]|nr:uroporphyrinogen-III C-methyltransferase [Gemmatimonadota bacterium]